jgi:hypothetical protein
MKLQQIRRFFYLITVVTPIATTTLGQTVFNVDSAPYNAVGDGIHNDQPNIQMAIQAANTNPSGNSVLVFGTNKVYLLQGAAFWSGGGTSGAHLLWERYAPGFLTILGNNSTLLSATPGTNMLQVWGYWQNSTVQDLTFSNTHAVTPLQMGGILAQSYTLTSPYASGITNITVTRCIFSGFQEGMFFSGAQNVSIISNTFLMPYGRDSGSSTNWNPPNVGIWLYPGPTINSNNTFNYTRNFTIANNAYNGCSQNVNLSNTVSHVCGDGLVHADNPLQLHVYCNAITNFSVEAIFANILSYVYPDVIMSNEVSQIYSNTVDNASLGPAGFGVSADMPGIQVHHNTIIETSAGLFAYNTQNGATNDVTGLSFHDNSVSVGPATNFYGYAGALALQIVGVSSSEFYSNSFALLGGAPPPGVGKYAINATGSGDGPPRIASRALAVHNNTFTAQFPINGFTNITIWNLDLSNPVTNFMNNTFNWLQYDVQALNYPLGGYAYPNDQSPSTIACLIHNENIYTGCSAAPSGLVSWWKGESNVNDAMGINNGIAQGSLSYQQGEVNNAFSMNGTDADVRVPSSSSLNVGTSGGFTVEGWFNITDNTARPITEWNSGSAFGVHFWANFPSEGYLYANVVDTGGANHYFQSTSTFIQTSNHVALTYDKSSGNAYIYLNGSQVVQTNIGNITPQTTYDLYLGARISGSPTRWAGWLDEISLYNRALSACEIAEIYNGGFNGKCNP